MDRMRSHMLLPLALLLAALSLAGCVTREQVASARTTVAVEPTHTPGPTPAIYSVEYRLGDTLLARESVSEGDLPSPPAEIEGSLLLGWTDADGQDVRPESEPVRSDTVYLAVTRPVIVPGTAFLCPDEHGLLRPEAPFTCGDAVAAARALSPEGGYGDALLSRWAETPDEALPPEDLSALCVALFPPERAESVIGSLPGGIGEPLTRARAAWCLARMAGDVSETENYYPDLSPEHWAYAELSAGAGTGALTPEALSSMTKEGFVWFDGYLYRPDENGYFLTDQVYDSLYFDPNGRYTSRNEELDGYVAAAIVAFSAPENTRLEDLHALYFHVKNDFEYLRRNYYDSGATGWEIEEALTIFRTNKGNCYCYAGAFCALARGMGYNAVTWSGSIGAHEQPHAWTEITLEDGVYICDPEIEMNYWVWMNQYTDNFMIRREKSGNWNYIAQGRSVHYE